MKNNPDSITAGGHGGALNVNPRAFSVLELIVTLLIVSLVCLAIFQVLNHTTYQSRLIGHDLEQLASIQYSLDQLMADIITAAQTGDKIIVEHGSYGRHETSRLTITSTATDKRARPVLQIDWVAAPRYEQEDLVLYRRESKLDPSESALYIPLCENIYSFKLDMYDADGADYKDPNTVPPLPDYGANSVVSLSPARPSETSDRQPYLLPE